VSRVIYFDTWRRATQGFRARVAVTLTESLIFARMYVAWADAQLPPLPHLASEDC